MAKRRKAKTNPFRIEDIDWSGLAQTITSERINATEARERYAPQITAPTFKRWSESPDGLGTKYSIDWGRVGRGNYIRLLPRKDSESDILRRMSELVGEYGMLACVRALGEVSSGGRRN